MDLVYTNNSSVLEYRNGNTLELNTVLRGNILGLYFVS